MSVYYQTKYIFGPYQLQVEDYINKLTNNSINYFVKQIQDKKILKDVNKNDSTYNYEYKTLIMAIKYVEEYLSYYFQQFPEIFPEILKVITDMSNISVLESKERMLYCKTSKDGNTVFFNPDLISQNDLTRNERIRLCVAHGLEKIINNQWMRDFIYYLRKEKNIDSNKKQLILDGFSLLDEVTAQERAEDISCCYTGKKRPYFKVFYGTRGMYRGTKYKSNFDSYQELQEPAILFSQYFFNDKENIDQDKTLNTLSIMALNKNFTKEILKQYIQKNQKDILYKQLAELGIIKNASMAKYCNDKKVYLQDSERAFNSLKAISKVNENYKEPFDD